MDVNAMAARVLPKLQAAAEALMTDRFTVSRSTGSMTVDPDTGVSKPDLTKLADVKGKVQTAGGIASQVVTASGDSTNVGGNVPVWSLYIQFPVSLTGLRSKDVAVCTASRDPDLIGRRYRLVNPQSEKSWATARRWNVMEQPEETS